MPGSVAANTPLSGTWTPQPRQAQFLKLQTDEGFYGGAAGGGKTDVGLAWQILRRNKYPGSRGLFIRRKFANLNRPGAAIERSHQLLSNTDAYWRGDEYTWYWPNGGRLSFGHVNEERNKFDYLGAQVDDMVFDELGEFSETSYEFIISRTRTTYEGLKTRIRATGNPGGIGHAWIKRRFRVVDSPPGTTFQVINSDGKVTKSTASFIPAKVTDNKLLMRIDPGYIDKLDALPEYLRRAYKDGDWSIFEGQFFVDWNDDRIIVEPWMIPDWWPRWIAWDYGYHPGWACALWLAKDPYTLETHVYREMYEQRMQVREQARAMIEMTPRAERRLIKGVMCDPSIMNLRSAVDLPSIAEEAAEEGLRPLWGADNRRTHGWSIVRGEMAWCRWAAGLYSKCDRPLACDHRAYPRLRVWSNCTNTIRTIPDLVHNPINALDIDGGDPEIEDHAADTLRYGLVGVRKITQNERLTGKRNMIKIRMVA